MASLSEDSIIIKKIKKADHAHHGGAWKIAYADFVTAMMAFFMLLWLISMTTPEQKLGLANYFMPPDTIATQSGAGGIMGGNSADDSGASRHGAAIDGAKDVSNPAKPAQGMAGKLAGNPGQIDPAASLQKSNQDKQFDAAAASIRQAWQANPDITRIQSSLLIEKSEEGLDITISDQEGLRMFANGSKFPIDSARAAIVAMAPLLEKLSNQIRISGHTAAGDKYDNPRYGPWELSSDRANVVRDILGEAGLTDDHISAVVGRSTSDPFFINDPYLAANERVKITVLYTAPPVPVDLAP